MFPSTTVEQVMRTVVGDIEVDRTVLAQLMSERPTPAEASRHLDADDITQARAAVAYVSVIGGPDDANLLSMCLQHDDDGVATLAEFGLWRIWMNSGTEPGNRRLSFAIRCIKHGSYETAAEALEHLQRQEPHFAEAWFQRGIALSFLDRTREARHDYERALAINPHHFGAAVALGHTCVEQADMSGALHYYKRALKIHPRLAELPQAVRELEALVGTGSPYNF